MAALFVAVLVVTAAAQADPPQRRRAHGPRSGGRDGGCAPGDSRAGAGGLAAPAAAAAGGRAALRRRRDRRPTRRGRRAGARRGRRRRGSRAARAPRGRRRRPRRAAGARRRPRFASGPRKRRSTCRDVREVHNVNVLTVDGRTEISLHLKLPGDADPRRGACGRRAGRAIDSRLPFPRRRPCGRISSRSPRRRRAGGRATWEVERARGGGVADRQRGDGRRIAAGAARARDRATASSSSSRSRLDPHTELVDAHGRRAPSRSGSVASGPTSPTSTCTRNRRLRRCGSACSRPLDRDLPRGWPGRIEGDRVIQLAAQTLQAFFTGGGKAREHAEYRLDDVRLLLAGAAAAVDPRLLCVRGARAASSRAAGRGPAAARVVRASRSSTSRTRPRCTGPEDDDPVSRTASRSSTTSSSLPP